MSSSAPIGTFGNAEAVINYFHEEITSNGNPDLGGVEEEIIVVDANGKPINHARFQIFLKDLINILPQGAVMPGKAIDGKVIPVLWGSFDGGSVQPETNTTLVELAHAPVTDAWGSFRQSRLFAERLKEIATRHDLYVIGGGAVPTVGWHELQPGDVAIPNADYAYSWGHMTQGTRPEYCRTVFGTASVHHNTGFDDPEKMARYITTSLRIQPTMIAMLGNSPIWDHRRILREGEPLLSYRSHVQIDYGRIFGDGDGVSYLYPDFLIDPHADFASIIRGYLDLPLDRTIVGGQKRECPGLTMRQYLRGYEIDGRVHYPCAGALTMMIREPIVDVRPCFNGPAPRVETRAHDCVSQHCAVAIDAFYRGIVANLDQAQDLMSGIDGDELRRARHKVCEQGLASRLRHARRDIATQQDLALRLLAIADEGLGIRGLGEEALLTPLYVLAETGINPAQRLLTACDKTDKAPRDILNSMDYGQHGFADGTTYSWPDREPRAMLFGSQRRIICSP